MSRIKTSKAQIDKKNSEWPFVIYVWMAGLAVVGYVVARIALESYPHPVHWGAGLIGGLLGVPIGWVWYRWRGDIF